MNNNLHIRQGIRDIPEICSLLGVRNVIICPGSRNAPLILAFAKYSTLNCLSLTDERSAAYFAVGIAQHSHEPVVLICTSGTAALNFAPAIAEAFYQQLPLIVLTADRPVELIDQADGQAIRQNNIYSNNIKASFQLPVETVCNEDLWYNNRIISQAIQIALQEPKGPTHINVPIREPLYIPLPEKSENLKIGQILTNNLILPEPERNKIKDAWKNYAKKLVIIGFMPSNERTNQLINTLATDPGTIIVAENLSNLCGKNVVFAPERLIASFSETEMNEFQPQLLVTMGGSIVSKRLKQFLRKYSAIEHWHIEPSGAYTDTYQSLSHRIAITVNSFLEELIYVKTEVDTNYADLFASRNKLLNEQSASVINQAPFSDILAIGQILNMLPSGSLLHLANSTPVRFSQYFPTRNDIVYYANRGTSGIDGSISSAAGNAYVSQKPTFIISGDLAFIYDSNALWNNYLPENFRIIVINNGSGNIFKLIDTSTEIDAIQHFFETPHKVNIRKLTEAFGLKWFYCDNQALLQSNFEEMTAWKGPALLEIKTLTEINIAVFKSYYKNIKNTSQ